jgi:hypothetical protein
VYFCVFIGNFAVFYMCFGFFFFFEVIFRSFFIEISIVFLFTFIIVSGVFFFFFNFF